MPFHRKTAEEKAARREAKWQQKEETRARLKAIGVATVSEEENKRREKLTALLQPDEEVEALLKASGKLTATYVLFTSKRLIVAPASNPGRAESILYRAIGGFTTSNFITKDVSLDITGRRDRLELAFKTAEERDEALRLLQAHIL
jgi:hypothetical protein